MKEKQTPEPREKSIIAVEGIDDYMNTLQCRKIYEYLLRKYCVDSGTGKYVLTRSVLLSTGVSVIRDVSVRDVRRKNEHLGIMLEPFFRGGGILIANGYKMQTRACREMAGRKKSLKKAYKRFPSDITFLIDVDVETAIRNMEKMKHQNGDLNFEELQVLGELYRGYEGREDVVTIRGESEKKIFKKIRRNLKGLFPKV
jgi:thymidylate kinase